MHPDGRLSLQCAMFIRHKEYLDVVMVKQFLVPVLSLCTLADTSDSGVRYVDCVLDSNTAALTPSSSKRCVACCPVVQCDASLCCRVAVPSLYPPVVNRPMGPVARFQSQIRFHQRFTVVSPTFHCDFISVSLWRGPLFWH